MSTAEERATHEASLKEFGEDAVVGKLNDGLLDVLRFLGKTGSNCYAWSSVQPVLMCRLEQVLQEGQGPKDENKDEYESDKKLAVESLSQFSEAPFTLQRLCEVLTDTSLTTGRKEKLMWALLKLLCISTTIPIDKFPYEVQNEPNDDPPSGMPVESDIPGTGVEQEAAPPRMAQE